MTAHAWFRLFRNVTEEEDDAAMKEAVRAAIERAHFVADMVQQGAERLAEADRREGEPHVG